MSAQLFHVVSGDIVKIPVHARLSPAKVTEAHSRLEARQMTGTTVLLP